VELIVTIAIVVVGALFTAAHFYVKNTAKSEANAAVDNHIKNCAVPGIIAELHEDVREIRNHLLGNSK
jgi:hypothetical protein